MWNAEEPPDIITYRVFPIRNSTFPIGEYENTGGETEPLPG